MKPARTRNCPITKGNFQRAKLERLLSFLGVRRRTTGLDLPAGLLRKLPEGKKWDLYEQAKSNWRAMIWKAHPDRGGNHERAAFLNAVWTRVKELFGRLGISEG